MAGKRKRSGSIIPRTSTVKTTVVASTPRSASYYRRSRDSDGEVKFVDTTVAYLTTPVMADSSIGTQGTFVLIPQGDGQSQREGRKCRITELQMNGQIRAVPGATGTGGATVYITWVLDTQANGAAAAATDVWAGGAMPSQQMLNLANEGRFKILSKQVYNLPSTAGVSGAYSTVLKPFSWRKKVSIPMEYDNNVSTAGVIGSIRRNNIICFMGDDNLSVTPCYVDAYIRARFVG